MANRAQDEDPQWLAVWRSASRTPLFHSDQPSVWRMLAAAWERETVEFRYWGGSNPGELRRFSPLRVFQVGGGSGVYVTGYCHLRHEERTLRLDYVQWPRYGPASARSGMKPAAAVAGATGEAEYMI